MVRSSAATATDHRFRRRSHQGGLYRPRDRRRPGEPGEYVELDLCTRASLRSTQDRQVVISPTSEPRPVSRPDPASLGRDARPLTGVRVPPEQAASRNAADRGVAYRRRSLPLDEVDACAALRPCTERRQRKLARPRSREADQARLSVLRQGHRRRPGAQPIPVALPPAPRRWFRWSSKLTRPGRYTLKASSTSSSAGSHARCNSKSTCERPTSDRPPRSRRLWLAGADPDLLDRVTRLRAGGRSSSNADMPGRLRRRGDPRSRGSCRPRTTCNVRRAGHRRDVLAALPPPPNKGS